MQITSAATTAKTSSTGSTSSTSSSSSSADLSSEFMTLLVAELKAQDPTSPMDTTAMVGQMVSLNELDQITSIHTLLSSALTSTTSTTGA